MATYSVPALESYDLNEIVREATGFDTFTIPTYKDLMRFTRALVRAKMLPRAYRYALDEIVSDDTFRNLSYTARMVPSGWEFVGEYRYTADGHDHADRVTVLAGFNILDGVFTVTPEFF